VVCAFGKNGCSRRANIRMLAGDPMPHKVNFCKFTKRDPNGLEDSSEKFRPGFVAVINGTASRRRFELALGPLNPSSPTMCAAAVALAGSAAAGGAAGHRAD